MKVSITPKSRNRDNSRELLDAPVSRTPTKVTKTGVTISFDTQISTSGSFGAKIELTVADVYALLGKLAEFHHGEATEAKSARIRTKNSAS